jgi:hypothetical protein
MPIRSGPQPEVDEGDRYAHRPGCCEHGLNGRHRSDWAIVSWKKNGDVADVVYFVGVPISDFFEHLAVTISEATPLYELCASVLA